MAKARKDYAPRTFGVEFALAHASTEDSESVDHRAEGKSNVEIGIAIQDGQRLIFNIRTYPHDGAGRIDYNDPHTHSIQFNKYDATAMVSVLEEAVSHIDD